MSINRRQLLAAMSGTIVLSSLGCVSAAKARIPDYPFRLGVASGDPWPDGFVIWTRLAVEPTVPGAGVPASRFRVRWEVAEDPQFRKIVRQGHNDTHPDLGHAVHVELMGLNPRQRYWYRFHLDDFTSPVGTVRTAPAAMADVDQLRIGVAGCQNYEHGYYTAYKYLAQETDLDAVFHYGDYIYEKAPGIPSGFVNRQGERVVIPTVREHIGPEPTTLQDYRLRYALYKSDPDLQAAHAAAAFMVTYDDHEIDNNWAGIHDQDGSDPKAFLIRRAAALQAWYENMPVRSAQLPVNDGLQMYRSLDYGKLLRVHLLDTRQYRDDQICTRPDQKHCRDSDELQNGLILGRGQHEWLHKNLNNNMHWNLIAQQVVVMPMDTRESDDDPASFNTDAWEGYPESRRRIVKAIRDHDLSNVVISTGDVHQNIVGYLPADERSPERDPVATEFVCTSISSLGDGSDVKEKGADFRKVIKRNGNLLYANAQRGYQVFTINSTEWRTDIMKVDKVSDRSGQLSRLTSFTREKDSPIVHQGISGPCMNKCPGR